MQSLKKSERINDAKLIRSIRQQGARFSLGALSVSTLPNQKEGPRLAVALTAKSGLSVTRNRIRRAIREFFRKNKDKLGSYDFFFCAYRDLNSLTGRDALDSFFQRLLKWHHLKK